MRFLSKCVFVYLTFSLCGGQQAHAGFMDCFVASPAPAAPAQPIAVQASAPAASLHQMATQAPAHEVKTMREATQSPAQHDGPSLTLMAITYEYGKPCGITAPFTPEEIDKYPNHAARFLEHAEHSLGSSNTHDVAAISYLVDKYPEFAQNLYEMAKHNQKVNPSLKKHLFRASHPIMTTKMAATIVTNSLVMGSLYTANNILLDKNKETVKQSAARVLIDNDNPFDVLPGHQRTYPVFRSATTMERLTDFFQTLPRDIPVAIGTSAIMNLASREIEERVGDPFACPKYDPKTNNVTRYACEIFKKIVLPFVASQLVSHYVVSPAYDGITSAAQKVFLGSNT